jgi:ABC-type antimicrobial peptide transport system permease subunit
MERIVARQVVAPRFYGALLGAFAAVALALASIGVYGVISYGVARRTREIGLRLALGARPREVVRLVIRQGMLPAAGGAALGVLGALALTRNLDRLLYGVRPTDPATLVVVTLVLIAVAFVACLVPARRASSVDPMTALRTD